MRNETTTDNSKLRGNSEIHATRITKRFSTSTPFQKSAGGAGHRRRPLLLGLLAFVGLGLSFSQAASGTAVLENPDWDVTLTESGYSDLLIYDRGYFPAGYLHEMLSGESVAAIGYG